MSALERCVHGMAHWCADCGVRPLRADGSEIVAARSQEHAMASASEWTASGLCADVASFAKGLDVQLYGNWNQPGADQQQAAMSAGQLAAQNQHNEMVAQAAYAQRAAPLGFAKWMPVGVTLGPIFGVDRSKRPDSLQVNQADLDALHAELDRPFVERVPDLDFESHPYPSDLAFALFRRRMRAEAERIAEGPSDANRVMEVMWLKTKPTERAACEAEADDIAAEWSK